MLELLFLPETWIAFATLTALEIVLGIDNIIVIAILVSKLPEHQRAAGRFFGLALAMVTPVLSAGASPSDQAAPDCQAASATLKLAWFVARLP
ncbi:MAG: TerC family protein, partial [Halothiobacillus sp.]